MADATKSLKFLLLGEDKTASRALKGIGSEADKTTGKLRGMGTVAGGVFGGQLMTQAASAAADFGKASLEAFRDASASQRKLDDAFERFPKLANASKESLRSLNQQIQKKTGADADDMAGAQAVLAQYELTGAQIAQLTPLLDDYATKTGKSLPEAAEVLGKAMLGQGRALKEVGINFKDTKTLGGNFDQLMTGLRDKVGGFAEKEGKTAEGQLKKLNAEFGDVQEEVGEQLLPVLVQLGQGLLTVINFLKENRSVIEPLVAILGPMALAIAAVSAAQGILNLVMAANPIGIVVITLAALAGALVYAYQHSEEFRKAVDIAFKGIADVARWLWNAVLRPVMKSILDAFANVTRGLAELLQGMGQVPGMEWAKQAAENLQGASDKAREFAASLKEIQAPPAIVVPIKVDYTSKRAAMSGAYASGGRPAVGQWALVGENGPELWMPDRSGTIVNASDTASMLRGGGSSTVINVPVTVSERFDATQAARQIAWVMA